MLALGPPLCLNLLVADCLRMFLMKLNKKNMASQQERGFGVSYLEIAIAQDCLGYMPHCRFDRSCKSGRLWQGRFESDALEDRQARIFGVARVGI